MMATYDKINKTWLANAPTPATSNLMDQVRKIVGDGVSIEIRGTGNNTYITVGRDLTDAEKTAIGAL